MAGERTLPGLGLRAYWTVGSNGWEAQHDPDTRTLSALCQAAVISRVTSLPGLPTDGDIYIVPTADANGDQIALRDDGAWAYIVPKEGFLVHVNDEDEVYRWTGTAWAKFGKATEIELSLFAAGTLASNEIVFAHVATKTFTVPASAAGSKALAGVASTGSPALSLKKNGVEFGTVTFAAGTSGVFAAASTTAFAVNDRLTVTAPATADATLADVSISLKGEL